MAARSLARIVHQFAKQTPQAEAVVSPFSTHLPRLTYFSLSRRAGKLATALQARSFKNGDIIASDLPNTEHNILLQVALSHMGASVAAVKDEDELSKLGSRVRGAVAASSSSWLASRKGWEVPPIVVGENSDGEWSEITQEGTSGPDMLWDTAANDEDAAAAYFGGKALKNREVLQLAEDAAKHLSISASDRVCVAVTLMHSFGIATGAASALSRGACLVLPAAGGIRGCGNPTQRAQVSLQAVREAKCTLLVGDSHTLKGLHELLKDDPHGSLGALRGGVCKIGSGNDFLSEVSEEHAKLMTLKGVVLRAFGKKEK